MTGGFVVIDEPFQGLKRGDFHGIQARLGVENIFETTAIWDDAECDGSCWHEEAKNLLEFGV